MGNIHYITHDIRVCATLTNPSSKPQNQPESPSLHLVCGASGFQDVLTHAPTLTSACGSLVHTQSPNSSSRPMYRKDINEPTELTLAMRDVFEHFGAITSHDITREQFYQLCDQVRIAEKKWHAEQAMPQPTDSHKPKLQGVEFWNTRLPDNVVKLSQNRACEELKRITSSCSFPEKLLGKLVREALQAIKNPLPVNQGWGMHNWTPHREMFA